MDLAQRLNHLESVHDWQGLVEELEKGIAAEGDATRKAAYHLKLGRLLEEKFLQAVKALKHFQDAYKLNPRCSRRWSRLVPSTGTSARPTWSRSSWSSS